MEKQLKLLDEYEAERAAVTLKDILETAEDSAESFDEFCRSMESNASVVSHFPYDFLDIVGLGLMQKCLVWQFEDTSMLVAGTLVEGTMTIGALPPGTTFHPVPATVSGISTIH